MHIVLVFFFFWMGFVRNPKELKRLLHSAGFEHSLGDIQALVWVLSTSRWRQYSIMNTFHTLDESRVPVEHHATLEVCRLEYLKTLAIRQFSILYNNQINALALIGQSAMVCCAISP